MITIISSHNMCLERKLMQNIFLYIIIENGYLTDRDGTFCFRNQIHGQIQVGVTTSNILIAASNCRVAVNTACTQHHYKQESLHPKKIHFFMYEFLKMNVYIQFLKQCTKIFWIADKNTLMSKIKVTTCFIVFFFWA